jgi:hypothetical protein
MRRWTILAVALFLTLGLASGGSAQTPGGSGEKTMEKDKMEKGKMMDKKGGKTMEKKGGKTMEKKDGAMEKMDKMEKKEEKK